MFTRVVYLVSKTSRLSYVEKEVHRMSVVVLSYKYGFMFKYIVFGK